MGRGIHRKCYIHPQAPDKCIKILSTDIHKKGYLTEKRRERAYYGLLAKRNVSWSNLAKYYGETQTDAGCGSVFELIRDDDGEVSKTFQYYLATAQPGEFNVAELVRAVQELYTFMLEERIITMNLKAANICYQRKQEGRGRLVLVDSLGHADFIPLVNHVAFLAELKIRRRWSRFAQTVLQTCGSNPTLNRALHTLFATQGLCRPGTRVPV